MPVPQAATRGREGPLQGSAPVGRGVAKAQLTPPVGQDSVPAVREGTQTTGPGGGVVSSPESQNLEENYIPSVAPVIYLGRRNGNQKLPAFVLSR